MRKQRFWLAASLLLGGATFAHGASLLNPILAITDVPEPSSVMLGAGALLVVLGLARRRQQK